MKLHNRFFFIPIVFFALGFINITFSIVGLICFITPFALYMEHKDKVWCKYYCPRAGFLNKLSKISLNLKRPRFLRNMKKVMLYFFAINIFFATMSTIMVAIGRIEAVDYIRFLIIVPLTSLPQLITLNAPDVFIHLGYRVYSIMFTTTVLGLLLGILYLPRTWCMVCPINTILSNNKNTE